MWSLWTQSDIEQTLTRLIVRTVSQFGRKAALNELPVPNSPCGLRLDVKQHNSPHGLSVSTQSNTELELQVGAFTSSNANKRLPRSECPGATRRRVFSSSFSLLPPSRCLPALTHQRRLADPRQNTSVLMTASGPTVPGAAHRPLQEAARAVTSRTH